MWRRRINGSTGRYGRPGEVDPSSYTQFVSVCFGRLARLGRAMQQLVSDVGGRIGECPGAQVGVGVDMDDLKGLGQPPGPKKLPPPVERLVVVDDVLARNPP